MAFLQFLISYLFRRIPVFLAAVALFVPSAQAIIGFYEPEAFLPQSCWLIREQMRQRGWEKVESCSGTLVAPNRILTAQHCTMGFDGPTRSERYRAECGGDGTYKRPASKSLEITGFERMPGWLPTSQDGFLFDLALAKVNGSFTAMAPLAVADDFQSIRKRWTKSLCWLVGWGQDLEGGDGIQHAVSIPSAFLFLNSALVSARGSSVTPEMAELAPQGYLLGGWAYGYLGIDRSKDFNSKNGAAAGDSGGSLVCRVGPGMGKLVLEAVITRNPGPFATTGVLTSGQQAKSWLQSQLK